jgi:alpha-1,6-mannosyltransferase
MEPGRFALIIVGRGPLDKAVQQAADELPGLTWVSDLEDPAELVRYYKASDLFVHPGVCETFGLVALESQACARPVVGIRGSYMDANIFSGLDHWAMENSPEALAKAIADYSELDLEALGQQAAQTVSAGFSWTQVLSEMELLYQRAVEMNRRRQKAGALFSRS